MMKYKKAFLSLFLSLTVLANLTIVVPFGEIDPEPERIESIIHYNQQ
ncbi:hypothetical protein [Anaerosalibacter sp. Marseille-P3206]|nr:hypothetical protein [Anaerosalibacter sp. Marseille-P3206]